MSKWISQFRMLFERLCQFLQWWKEGMLAFLPDHLQKKWLASSQLLLIALQDNKLNLLSFLPLKTTELKSYDLALSNTAKDEFYKLLDHYHKRCLLIPRAHILITELSLPAATQKNLNSVIGYEIDRLTPYKMNEVYFDHKIQGISNEGRNILIKVFIIPKVILDETLAKFSGLNIRFDGVKVNGEDGIINILPKSLRSNLNKTEKNARLLWTLAVLALTFAFIAPLLYLRQNTINLEKKAATLMPKAQTLSELEGNLNNLIIGNNFLSNRKAELVPVLVISNELSRLMPLDSYIEALDYDGKRITIRGLAKQASALSSLLESSAYFSEVTQTAPIVSDGRGSERFGFSIKVEKGQP